MSDKLYEYIYLITSTTESMMHLAIVVFIVYTIIHKEIK